MDGEAHTHCPIDYGGMAEAAPSMMNQAGQSPMMDPSANHPRAVGYAAETAVWRLWPGCFCPPLNTVGPCPDVPAKVVRVFSGVPGLFHGHNSFVGGGMQVIPAHGSPVHCSIVGACCLWFF